MDQQKNTEGLAWQISVWDRMVPIYVREIDKRFEPIVERVVKRADLKSGQHALDLGTGTGSSLSQSLDRRLVHWSGDTEHADTRNMKLLRLPQAPTRPRRRAA
jgi:hypothetical protein